MSLNLSRPCPSCDGFGMVFEVGCKDCEGHGEQLLSDAEALRLILDEHRDASGDGADPLLRRLTDDWMRYLGYTDERIATADAHRCADTCELVDYGYDCLDEDGKSRHPDVDELWLTADIVRHVLDALVSAVAAAEKDGA